MRLNKVWAGSQRSRRIARLVREKQTRIQGAAADARCGPLTLLLCFIEAIEVAFPRNAPRIFLGVSSLRGQRGKSGRGHRDRRKGRKSYHLRSDHKLGLRMSAPARKTLDGVWIFPNMPILRFAKLPARQAAGHVHAGAGHFVLAYPSVIMGGFLMRTAEIRGVWRPRQTLLILRSTSAFS
jgi:hypothetical protein